MPALLWRHRLTRPGVDYLLPMYYLGHVQIVYVGSRQRVRCKITNFLAYYIVFLRKKLQKKLHILRKCAIFAAKIGRFLDKTVRNLRVSECHESMLSNDRARADYLIKR